jgi:hypothetical protein
MNSIGLCKHNNVESYCPSCIREKSYNSRVQMAGRMEIVPWASRSYPKYFQPVKSAYYGPGMVHTMRTASGMRGMGSWWNKAVPSTAEIKKEALMYPEKYYPEDYNQYATMSGGMGATCQPGYYDLKILGFETGQCVPNLATATSAAQAGAASSLATGVATSPANIAAAKQAGISASANAAVAYVKKHPVMIASVVGGVALLALYGTGKLAFGRA